MIKMALGTEVGLGASHIVLDGNLASYPKRRQSPQFSAHFYCGQTAGWIKMPLGTEIGLCRDDFVLDVDPAPPNSSPPQFSAYVYCGQTAGCVRIPQPRRHCVRWGRRFPSPKGAQPANVRCDQTAGWTKMLLGTEVNLCPGDVVRWGRSSP